VAGSRTAVSGLNNRLSVDNPGPKLMMGYERFVVVPRDTIGGIRLSILNK
jgi:hypothetical protein